MTERCYCGRVLSERRANRYYAADRICRSCESDNLSRYEAERERADREHANAASHDRANRLLGV